MHLDGQFIVVSSDVIASQRPVEPGRVRCIQGRHEEVCRQRVMADGVAKDAVGERVDCQAELDAGLRPALRLCAEGDDDGVFIDFYG